MSQGKVLTTGCDKWGTLFVNIKKKKKKQKGDKTNSVGKEYFMALLHVFSATISVSFLSRNLKINKLKNKS